MDNLKTYFEGLLYKNITVMVGNYSNIAKTFTGILVQVNDNNIKLVITSTKKNPTPNKINFKRYFWPKSVADHIGAIVEIPLNEIDSFLHHPY